MNWTSVTESMPDADIMVLGCTKHGSYWLVTTDGEGLITWATAEFIAQEEMNRDTGYWWSPDERRIALQRTDESTVDIIPRLDITGGGASVIEQRYPRAGRPNALVELYVHDRETGQRTKVDLGANPDIYLARVDWSADGRTLYVQRQSRDQKTLDLLSVDPATGAFLVERLPTHDDDLVRVAPEASAANDERADERADEGDRASGERISGVRRT